MSDIDQTSEPVTALESSPEATPSAEPAAHKHDWVLRWQHPKTQRTMRDCADEKCGARLFTDGSDQHIGTVKDHAPWVKAEHVAAYNKSMQVKKN